MIEFPLSLQQMQGLSSYVCKIFEDLIARILYKELSKSHAPNIV